MINSNIVLVLNRCNQETADFLRQNMCTHWEGLGIYSVHMYMTIERVASLNQTVNLAGKTVLGVEHVKRMMFLSGMEFTGEQAVKIVIDEAIKQQENENEQSFF